MSSKRQLFEINESKIQDQVVQIGCWLSTQELAAKFRIDTVDLNVLLEKWKAEEKIFSVVYRGNELYLKCAFDDRQEYRPIKGLKPILQLIGDSKSNWGVAYWFAGVNGFLDGARPMDLLSGNPELVLKAAKEELAGIQHG